jgi:acetolactate synthase I/II/III large subunit
MKEHDTTVSSRPKQYLAWLRLVDGYPGGSHVFELLFDQPIPTADAIVAALDDAGIEYVLGIPGGYTGTLFTALHGHPRIRAVQVREESIGSAMADAYGRLTGRPIVVMGQGEWIAGNAGQGLLEAMLGSAPILVLTEMSEGGALSHHGYYQSGSSDYGSWDIVSALRGVTKRVMVSHAPAQAVQHTQLAIKHALTGEPGPVAVVYHGDALQGTVGPDSVPRLYPTRPYLPRRSQAVDVAALDEAARALTAARRPVIVAGNGVRVGQAFDELAALARSLDAPVATTAGGKGVFPEVDPSSAGVIGTFGNGVANAIVGTADVVVAVGTKLAPIDTGDENTALLDPGRQVLIQIDVEPLNASWTYPVDHVLVGEAGYVMTALAAAMIRAVPKAATDHHESTAVRRVADAEDAYGELDSGDRSSDEVPFVPRRTIELLQETIPEDAVVTCDAGENRLFMMHWYRAKASNSYLQPAAGGGMGYAVPAALGAKLAFPDRPVVAVCGDGGFAMSIHGLMTAVQQRLAVTVVVFNNNALGWVLHGMGDRAVAAGFDEFDHAAIARSLGCDGVRVDSAEALRQALLSQPRASVPLVIDVPTSLKTSFKDVVQPISASRWKRSE